MTNSNQELIFREAEFLKYHDWLRRELNNSNHHFAILKHLRNLKRNYLEEFNIAPTFFGLTMHAHLLETIMRLSRLLDNRTDSISMFGFLNFVEQNRSIFSKKAFSRRMYDNYDDFVRSYAKLPSRKIAQDRRKLERIPIENLKTWRNKAAAHMDKRLFLQDIDISEKYPLRIKQVDRIIDTLDKMLNDYSLAFKATTWVKDLASLEFTIQQVMDALRLKNQQDRHRRLEGISRSRG